MATILSLTEYKAAKGILDGGQDAQLTALLPMVNEFIEQYCGRVFGPAGYTEQKEGITDHRGFYLYYVDNKPLQSVQSVNMHFYGTNAPFVVDVSMLDVFEKEGYARFAYGVNPLYSVVRPEYQNDFYYTIVYSGGSPVPQPVKLAAVNMLSDMVMAINESQTVSGTVTNTGALKTVKIGDYSETYEVPGSLFRNLHNQETGALMTQTVKDLLAPYRRMGQSVI